MLYLTLLDQFHPGIYSSQVIDVCDHLNKKYKANIRLVAFLSLRELIRSDARKKLKALSPTAIVLPSFPGLKNFQWTAVFLFFVCLFTRQRVVICRNMFCANMALRLKRLGVLKKVVLDGRSAMAAEIAEYDVFPVDYLRRNASTFEAYAVNHSDFRIAVSEQLVTYWQQKYGYRDNRQVVIPCTLDGKYFSNKEFVFSGNTEPIKKELGLHETDIVLVYSGSTAPWQSFELLEKILTPMLEEDSRVKILFLSKKNKDNSRLAEKYKQRVFIKWLDHSEVADYLACCDYGILLRDQSDTNKVASPVKFAEYLYAGLKVLITPELGDFSRFVKENNCGLVIDPKAKNTIRLNKVAIEEKKINFSLAERYFKKESENNESSYQQLINFLKSH